MNKRVLKHHSNGGCPPGWGFRPSVLGRTVAKKSILGCESPPRRYRFLPLALESLHRRLLFPLHLPHLGFHLSRHSLRSGNDSSAVHRWFPPLDRRHDSPRVVPGKRSSTHLGASSRQHRHRRVLFFDWPRDLSLGGAKSTVRPCLFAHRQRTYFGFPDERYRRTALALECDAFGGNSIGIRRRRPPNGPKRPEFRPRRVCRF